MSTRRDPRLKFQRHVRPSGWANSREAILAPSAETVEAVARFEARRRIRCAVPTAEAIARRGDADGGREVPFPLRS